LAKAEGSPRCLFFAVRESLVGPLRQTRRATISSNQVRTGHAIGAVDPPPLTRTCRIRVACDSIPDQRHIRCSHIHCSGCSRTQASMTDAITRMVAATSTAVGDWTNDRTHGQPVEAKRIGACRGHIEERRSKHSEAEQDRRVAAVPAGTSGSRAALRQTKGVFRLPWRMFTPCGATDIRFHRSRD
jgi:hypothetical protein